MPPLRIGELARLANVNVQTLRFYERKGLLPHTSRRLSGHREYAQETVGLIRFIKWLQELSFSLREIKEMLALTKKPRLTCGDTLFLTRQKIEEIDAEISRLRAIRDALVEGLRSCKRTDLVAECFDRCVEAFTREAMASRGAAAAADGTQEAFAGDCACGKKIKNSS
jgi:DNA-binding transcriptional MerR regulator